MKIELAGIKLDNTGELQGGISDGRSVTAIDIDDHRNLVRHNIPGMEGSIFQDMGRASVRITISGVIWGKNARSIVDSIRSQYKKRKPVAFNSDLTLAIDVSQVIIQGIYMDCAAGSKDKYRYRIILQEYIDPPSETPASSRDDAAAWVDRFAHESLGHGGRSR